jgi:hypothetical protein
MAGSNTFCSSSSSSSTSSSSKPTDGSHAAISFWLNCQHQV